MLLGVVALRAGKKILYDPANMHVTNVPEATNISSATTAKAGSSAR